MKQGYRNEDYSNRHQSKIEIGMEMDNDYFKIAEARIDNYEKYKKFLK